MNSMNTEALWLYLVNQYPNVYSLRGLAKLAESGLVIGGNILGKPYPKDVEQFKPDLVVFSPTPEDETTGIWRQIEEEHYPFIIFSHFLDRDTGSNERDGYRYKQHPHFLEPLHSAQRRGPVFAASRSGAELLAKTYELETHEVDFYYLGIDYAGIREAVNGVYRQVHGISVLRDHLWRADKGFAQALDIILDLASRYPEVTFTINQRESWRGSESVIRTLKQKYEHFKHLTADRKNIVFHPRLSTRDEYYRFFAGHDISFCLARIENFGAGMMEQSAAGIATVVPDIGCYPEQYHEYVYPLDQICLSADTLIQYPDLVTQDIGQRLSIAASFDVDHHIPLIAQFLYTMINQSSG